MFVSRERHRCRSLLFCAVFLCHRLPTPSRDGEGPQPRGPVNEGTTDGGLRPLVRRDQTGRGKARANHRSRRRCLILPPLPARLPTPRARRRARLLRSRRFSWGSRPRLRSLRRSPRRIRVPPHRPPPPRPRRRPRDRALRPQAPLRQPPPPTTMCVSPPSRCAMTIRSTS